PGHVLGWLILLAASLAFAIAAWIRGRPAGPIFPSDVFFILTVLVVGTVPFLNLAANSPLYNDAHFSRHSIEEALVSLSLMYLCFGIVWMLRPKLRPADHPAQAIDYSAPVLWLAALAFLAVSILPLTFGSYAFYKSEVFDFLSAQIT